MGKAIAYIIKLLQDWGYKRFFVQLPSSKRYYIYLPDSEKERWYKDSWTTQYSRELRDSAFSDDSNLEVDENGDTDWTTVSEDEWKEIRKYRAGRLKAWASGMATHETKEERLAQERNALLKKALAFYAKSTLMPGDVAAQMRLLAETRDAWLGEGDVSSVHARISTDADAARYIFRDGQLVDRQSAAQTLDADAAAARWEVASVRSSFVFRERWTITLPEDRCMRSLAWANERLTSSNNQPSIAPLLSRGKRIRRQTTVASLFLEDDPKPGSYQSALVLLLREGVRGTGRLSWRCALIAPKIRCKTS